jgi:hypothetical protein
MDHDHRTDPATIVVQQMHWLDANQWRVQWRDLGAMKQDREFATFHDALLFSRSLRKSCVNEGK